MDEWELIASIRRSIANRADVLVGIGDDVAVLAPRGSATLATVDMLIEGIHFDLDHCSPRDVGMKAMSVNLSDIAAMAGEPLAALVAVGLPDRQPAQLANELFEGLRSQAEAHGVALVGGDTNRSISGLVVSVTLLGSPTGRGPVLRKGATPGDALCVTGALGYSLDGRHLRFSPRVREAQLLHRDYSLHAMLDVSDGLGSDLFHLLDESGVGATIDADAIPVRRDSPLFGVDARDPLDHALHDGEDFELLFSLPKDDARRLIAAQPLGIPVSIVGEITAEPGGRIRHAGRIESLPRGGYRHQWS